MTSINYDCIGYIKGNETDIVYARMPVGIKPHTPYTGEWAIVNFTQNEYISHSTPRRTFKNYVKLFEADGDGYSRWMPTDDIGWVSKNEPLPFEEFEDVYGDQKYDHAVGFHDKTTYTTKECKDEYKTKITSARNGVAPPPPLRRY